MDRCTPEDGGLLKELTGRIGVIVANAAVTEFS